MSDQQKLPLVDLSGLPLGYQLIAHTVSLKRGEHFHNRGEDHKTARVVFRANPIVFALAACLSRETFIFLKEIGPCH